MSIIVGIRRGTRIIMAADSQTSFGDAESIPAENSRTSKIYKLGDGVLGSTGWALYDDIIADWLLTNEAPDLSSARAIFSFFMELWRVLHERYPFVNDQAGGKDTPFGDLDTSFLLATRGGLFKVSSDMGVAPFKQYYAIGSGAEYALGVLYTLYDSSLDMEEVADLAVKAAIAMDVHCGGEIDMMDVLVEDA